MHTQTKKVIKYFGGGKKKRIKDEIERKVNVGRNEREVMNEERKEREK